MNHTISCQIISQNPNSVNWIGGFYFEPDQSFNHVFDRFPEVHRPHLGLPLIEVELVSTTPVVTATNRPTEQENLLSFYILLNPRLRTLSKILLRDATKVFNDIAYNRFAMSFYHSVES